ncbi:MAG TPA: deoxyhypusine synthase family protein [Bdellovibrionales bacterium]|nr:deoxyhypusine synthase family protein [Bdellovibrionales bacterium]
MAQTTGTAAGPITQFINKNYLHFNAASLKEAAEAYKEHVDKGGKMFVTLAGAMSSAELGISLAEMIRQDKIHGISCTGANLEEDIFNLVAHEDYVRIPNWRELSVDEEMALLDRHLNRVTDTCIPEEQAIRRLEKPVLDKWEKASKEGKSYFPHEYFYQILKEGLLEKHYQIDPKNSWMMAAMEKNLPIFVPGWEDSTLGNIFAGRMMQGQIKPECMKLGPHYMVELANWYMKTECKQGIGFYQIGGGIAGDFPICVVPMLEQDMERETPKWAYFCQVSDSTTSYGSYSGAVPNEKITWGKLDKFSKRYIIESDASIVAPLMFAYVLGQ